MSNFNEGRTIDIGKFVPDVLAQVDEYKAIVAIQNPEMIKLWGEIEKIFDSQFILSAPETGIRLFEKMHSIKPLDSDTLEQRRYRVWLLYNQQAPFTRKWFMQSLDTLLGADNYSCKINTNSFEVRITFDKISIKQFGEVSEWLENIVPYNMLIVQEFLQKTFIKTSVSSFCRKGGYFSVKAVQKITLNELEYKPLYAGVYMRRNCKKVIKPANSFSAKQSDTKIALGGSVRTGKKIIIKAVE